MLARCISMHNSDGCEVLPTRLESGFAGCYSRRSSLALGVVLFRLGFPWAAGIGRIIQAHGGAETTLQVSTAPPSPFTES